MKKRVPEGTLFSFINQRRSESFSTRPQVIEKHFSRRLRTSAARRTRAAKNDFSIIPTRSCLSGDTYTSYLADQSFYVMRVGDDYLRLPGTGYMVMADKGGELPDLEDGQFAYITANLKDVCNNFGYVSSHTYYITSISSAEYLSYEDINERCDIPELGTDGYYSLFRYTKDDVLYLLVIRDNIFAYTDGGLFAEYERPDRGDPFEPFLNDMGE